MPPCHRGSSDFRSVRARSNDTNYAKFCAGSYRLTLGTYNVLELAAHTYDTAAWRFRHLRRDLNFPGVESLGKAKLLMPPPRLLDNDDRHRHRQVQRRLAIASATSS
jgi:hypothetical protein